MNGETGFDLAGSGAEPLEDGDPRRIGTIPLVGRLGAGGMGRVYLGVHEGRYVAVKQVLPSVVGEDKDFLRRFGHELDNLSRLPAEATAPLLAGDREARPPWFATAYVPGITLREAVELHGPLPADALWLLLREAAAGLAAVHALDMVHRDLKPSNAMLTLDGLTLIDFGVARAAEQSQLTRTGMVVGTPAYMSPEQASGVRASSGAVDVFALGSVLAYAASGRPPFGDESGHAVLYRIVHEEPDLQPLREADPELADVVASCLDKDYEGRPTAAELLELATPHAPTAAPLWPEDITELLTERAAFAARTPDEDDLPVPLPVPEPEPEVARQTEPEPRPLRKERNRRTRVLLAVLPVVVVATGTTLAVRLLPYTTSPEDEARATPPAATAPATSSPGGNPSDPASKGTSPSASPDTGKGDDGGKDGRDGDDGKDGTDGDPARGSGTGSGVGAGSGDAGSVGSGGAAGEGGSSDSGDSGGSESGSGPGSGADGSGGASGTASGGTSPGTPSSGWFTLRNGENGKCLTQVYGSASLGACTDATASWTFRSASGGTVKVINRSSGACLSSNGNGQATFVANCSQDKAGLRWRTGSGGTLSGYGGCLDLAFGGGVATHTCQSGAASQQWARS